MPITTTSLGGTSLQTTVKTLDDLGVRTFGFPGLAIEDSSTSDNDAFVGDWSTDQTVYTRVVTNSSFYDIDVELAFIGGGGAFATYLTKAVENIALTLGKNNDTLHYDAATPVTSMVVDAGGGLDQLFITNFSGTLDMSGASFSASTTGSDGVVRSATFTGFDYFVVQTNATTNQLTGGNLGDNFVVRAGTNTIFGGGGNDTIDVGANEINVGSTGFADGGTGNDYISFSSGTNTAIGGAGDDIIGGGQGVDTVVFSGAFSNYAFLDLAGSLRAVDQRAGSPDGTDQFSNAVEFFRFSDGTKTFTQVFAAPPPPPPPTGGLPGNQIGTAGADTLIGDGTNNILLGNGGADKLVGNGGVDVLEGGAGNDDIDGGAGNDTAVFSANIADFSFLTLASGAIQVTDLRAGSPQGIDTVLNVESFNFKDGTKTAAQLTGVTPPPPPPPPTGGQPGNQIGTAGADTLIGDGGQNILIGNGGADRLVGNGGVDVLEGGAGNDDLDGGAGSDTAVFSANFADFSFQTLASGAIQVTDLRAGSPQGIDTVLNVESFNFKDGTKTAAQLTGVTPPPPPPPGAIVGTAAGETLTGTDAANTIQGLDGGDTLFGRGGVDNLEGGNGGDYLAGGAGADTLNGGAGLDQYFIYNTGEVGDTITTFEAGEKIMLKGSGFGGLAVGALNAVNFWSTTTNQAHDADDRFVFNTTDSTLWYDSNGNVAGGGLIMVADLGNTFALSASDITII